MLVSPMFKDTVRGPFITRDIQHGVASEALVGFGSWTLLTHKAIGRRSKVNRVKPDQSPKPEEVDKDEEKPLRTSLASQ